MGYRGLQSCRVIGFCREYVVIGLSGLQVNSGALPESEACNPKT